MQICACHCCAAGGCRTQHNIVGLLPGRLGVPHAPLPPSCCLQPIDVSNISSCGSESRERVPKGEDKRRECALFTSRDGAVGIIQVSGPECVRFFLYMDCVC